jgi:hypothetical protein
MCTYKRSDVHLQRALRSGAASLARRPCSWPVALRRSQHHTPHPSRPFPSPTPLPSAHSPSLNSLAHQSARTAHAAMDSEEVARCVRASRLHAVGRLPRLTRRRARQARFGGGGGLQRRDALPAGAGVCAVPRQPSLHQLCVRAQRTTPQPCPPPPATQLRNTFPDAAPPCCCALSCLAPLRSARTHAARSCRQ